jgi:hypothetical protein
VHSCVAEHAVGVLPRADLQLVCVWRQTVTRRSGSRKNSVTMYKAGQGRVDNVRAGQRRQSQVEAVGVLQHGILHAIAARD